MVYQYLAKQNLFFCGEETNFVFRYTSLADSTGPLYRVEKKLYGSWNIE